MSCAGKEQTIMTRGFFAAFKHISTKDSKDPNLVTKYNVFRTHLHDLVLKFVLC